MFLISTSLLFVFTSLYAEAPITKENTRIGTLEFTADYPTDQTVQKLYEEMDFQRAVQAYMWAMPTVALNEMYLANNKKFGLNFGDQIFLKGYITPKNMGLTPNDTTIYTIVYLDLSKEPYIVESPAGAYGVIDDYWQRPISEIGALGPDKGKGGKFLILPPDYKGKAPKGYFVVQSNTNKVMYMVRAFVKNDDVKSAVESLTKVTVYPLSKAKNPTKQKVVDGSSAVDTIAPKGFEYWERLSSIIDTEPVQERDRFFMAMLKPLGIEKGKKFAPNEKQKKILTEAAEVGFRMSQAVSFAPRFENVVAYPNTHWEYVITMNPNQKAENYEQLDERLDYTFEAITMAEGMVKHIVGAGSQYYEATRDKDGKWLDGSNTYTLHIPANVPVKEFWSVTVYDNMTRSMIDTDTQKPSLSSKNSDIVKNSDGSINIYFGPTAPKGKEANWIKTIPNKGWFTYFRWYSPTEAFFDQTWKLKDIEKSDIK